MSFRSISIDEWRQFSLIDIKFDNNVTIITGSNGSGKTSILNLLANHYGWNPSFISTPIIGKKSGKRIWSDFLNRVGLSNFSENPQQSNNRTNIGSINYDNSLEPCIIWTPENSTAQYIPNFENKQNVSGIHIPSHRPNNSYHSVDNIPTNPKSLQNHYQEFQQILLQTYSSSPRQNPGIIQKQSIISLGLFGYGNQVVTQNQEYIDAFEGFQEILEKILPKDIGFKKLEIRMPEVVLVTNTGDFALEAMSGGINALFGIAWQIFMFGQTRDSVVVTIDEPENHLHPSMQRSIIPSLQRAFPNYQFIIATHSPFIVTSSRNAAVYGLHHDESGQVSSSRLTEQELAGSPNRILRDILNVPSTIPLWAEEEILNSIKSTSDMLPAERAEYLWKRFESMGLIESLSEIGDDVALD